MASTHPLELIPFFRRFPCSVRRDLVYTAIWNTLIAIAFALVAIVVDPGTSFGASLRETFVFAQCIGFLIHALFYVGEKAIGPRVAASSLWLRCAYYAAIPIVAIFPGYLLAFRLLDVSRGAEWLLQPRTIVSILALSLLLTGMLLLVFIPRERAAKAEAAVAREQARLAALAKEAETARYKLLEAQIEPHFLYNTLAHVVSLVDREPAAARRMIERLITLLRSTAVNATAADTIGAQVEHLRAYLEILELRMGARLAWRIDLPPDLAALPVPPMLLQPLVENAVKHGLEPSISGGTLAIAARRENGRVLLEVADTGCGVDAMAAGRGSGLGLSNLRARLAAQFGADASFTLEDNAPQGTRATIVLPWARLVAARDAPVAAEHA